MLEPDVKRLLEEANVFSSLVNHPGWSIIKAKLDEMLADATEKLNEVPATDVDKVLAAHRDWKAVRDVRNTLIEYIQKTIEYAAEYQSAQKENLQ